MKLHQIKALVAIHQTGNISAASQILHATQPAISRSRELCLALLRSSHRGMSLADEGCRIIRHA